jgi:hypothetical protein
MQMPNISIIVLMAITIVLAFIAIRRSPRKLQTTLYIVAAILACGVVGAIISVAPITECGDYHRDVFPDDRGTRSSSIYRNSSEVQNVSDDLLHCHYPVDLWAGWHSISSGVTELPCCWCLNSTFHGGRWRRHFDRADLDVQAA